MTYYFTHMKPCITCGASCIHMDKEYTGKKMLVRVYCPSGCHSAERTFLLNGTPEQNAAKEEKTVKEAIEGWKRVNTRGARRW